MTRFILITVSSNITAFIDKGFHRYLITGLINRGIVIDIRASTDIVQAHVHR
jgi:hypothetical protein